jgi:phosphatidylinositol alpha-1,6-mannosyltransferase
MTRVHVATVAVPNVHDANPRIHRMSFPFRGAHRPTNILRWTAWAREFVRQNDIAVVHAGNIRPSGYVAAMLRRQLGIPYLVYVHGKDLLKERRKGRNRWLVRAGTREILGNAAGIVANSRATANLTRDILRALGSHAAAERVHVVHPGAEPKTFAAAAAATRQTNEGPVLLSVARLVQRKGIDTTIEALPTILAAHPTTTYVIVGTGPDRTRLEQLAASLGVSEHVRFAGDVSDDDLPGFYAKADIFSLPTREIPAEDEIEGFGIAYVEASASGVPCIACDAGGVSDAVVDGVSGLLVAPTATAVADAALRLLGDAALRARLAEGGRMLVERDLNWDRAAREVIELVGAVARAPAGGGLTRPAVGAIRAGTEP